MVPEIRFIYFTSFLPAHYAKRGVPRKLDGGSPGTMQQLPTVFKLSLKFRVLVYRQRYSYKPSNIYEKRHYSIYNDLKAKQLRLDHPIRRQATNFKVSATACIC